MGWGMAKSSSSKDMSFILTHGSALSVPLAR
jgi:hypothetical protein